MKRSAHFLALLILLQFSGCYPYQVFESKDVSVIPAERSNPVAEMFYPDQALPQKDYLEMKYLKVAIKGNPSSKRLAALMQEKGSGLGMDGVVILEQEDFSFTAPNLIDAMVLATDMITPDQPVYDDYTTVHRYKSLNGIGIKYLENLNYLDRYIKNEDFYLVHDSVSKTQPVLLARLTYAPNGMVTQLEQKTESGQQYYMDYVKNYSHYYLLKDTVGWQDHYLDGKLTSRKLYRLDDWLLKKVKILYNERNQIRFIKVKNKESGHTEKISYHYLKEYPHLLDQRDIASSKGYTLQEKYTYDKNYRLISRDYFLQNDSIKIHVFKSLYGHYLNSDISIFMPDDEVSEN